MTRKPRQAGFTLIELLVAITMVSLLSVAGLYAMRVGFNALDKTGKQLAYERRVMGAQNMLEQMLVNLMPARATCHGGALDPATRAIPPLSSQIPFFDGRRDTMRFVSAQSLEEGARGTPRILELAIIAGRDGQGVRLIVNEHLYWGPLSTGYFCNAVAFTPGAYVSPYLPVQTGPQSYILADRMRSIRFLYRAPLGTAPFYTWIDEWTFATPPEAIRVEATPLTEGDGRPLTITAPIHVKRDYSGQVKYEDSFPVR